VSNRERTVMLHLSLDHHSRSNHLVTMVLVCINKARPGHAPLDSLMLTWSHQRDGLMTIPRSDPLLDPQTSFLSG
jgi:hypothetical protein